MKRLFILFVLVVTAIALGCGSLTDQDENAALSGNAGKAASLEYTIANPPNPVVVPANAVEVVAERGKYSKIYDNLDGTYTAVIHSTPMHYRDINGEWREVSLTNTKKIAEEDTVITGTIGANPNYNYVQDSYADDCSECKLGEQQDSNTYSRFLTEFNLASPDCVITVTAATVYFYAKEDLEGKLVGIIPAVWDINEKPSSMKNRPTPPYPPGNQINYENCENQLTNIYIDDFQEEESFGLGSSERNLIKQRCNAPDGSEWYAVGYRLANETQYGRLEENSHKLRFYFTRQ